MNNWEVKYVVLPFDIDTEDRSKGAMALTVAFNKLGERYKKAWDEVSKLASEGWEPISAASYIRSYMNFNASMHAGAGSSITDGILLVLKRPVEQSEEI